MGFGSQFWRPCPLRLAVTGLGDPQSTLPGVSEEVREVTRLSVLCLGLVLFLPSIVTPIPISFYPALHPGYHQLSSFAIPLSPVSAVKPVEHGLNSLKL